MCVGEVGGIEIQQECLRSEKNREIREKPLKKERTRKNKKRMILNDFGPSNKLSNHLKKKRIK